MQEGGFYRARVTAETVSHADTHQVDVLFHITQGEQAHVGEVLVTGSSGLTPAEVQKIAHLNGGDRITVARVSGALQRLRKKFQKQNRALSQVSIADQKYQAASNAVDFTFQIDPGPVVVIYARGYKISKRTLKKQIPVYEENAVDDDLLNEGKRNLLDYLQTRGHFDAKVEILKETDAKTMQVIYQIDPGALHKLVLVEITGNKDFLDTAKLKSYLQIQSTSRLLSHGRYSETLLKGDVATLEALYRSSGFRQVKIETKVDDNYEGSDNKLAVHIHIDEGVRTIVGESHVLGTQQVPLSELPETSTQPGQPYSEQDLANDRERILSYYFDHGFPNTSLDISTKPSDHEPNREDVTYAIQEGEHFTVNRVIVAGMSIRGTMWWSASCRFMRKTRSANKICSARRRDCTISASSARWIPPFRILMEPIPRKMCWCSWKKPSAIPSLMELDLSSRPASPRGRPRPRGLRE